MKPDEPYNYWQNIPATAAPVAPTPPAQPIPEPVIPPQPVQSPDVPQPAPIAPTPAPVEMYAPSPVTEPEPVAQLNNQTTVPPEQPAQQPLTDDDTVHWSASEYLYQEKNGLWFAIFALLVLGLIALDVLLLKTYTFSALITVMAIAVVVYYRRPPVEINYTLSPDHGLYVGEKLRTFNEFKSFAVINDHGSNFIMLIPTKRFSPALSVYFPAESGEQIVDILGQLLPMEERKLDAFDYIVRKLRI